MEKAKFTTALVLGLVLLAGFIFGRARADRLTKLLTMCVGCTAVLWAILGFLHLRTDQQDSAFRHYKYFVGGGLVGFGVALLTHYCLLKSEGNRRPPE
jgi:drug/metabolite transporter (DMT)-like permease